MEHAVQHANLLRRSGVEHSQRTALPAHGGRPARQVRKAYEASVKVGKLDKGDALEVAARGGVPLMRPCIFH
jgi:hypothetical protein